MFPVITNVKRLVTGTRTGKWLLGSAALIALAAPGVAQAGRNDREVATDRRGTEHREVEHREVEHREIERRDVDRHDFDRRDLDRHDGRVNIDVRIGARPEFEDREVRVWVEPVYRTETQQVWVPDQFEDRTVRYNDRGQWCTRVDHVLIVPGHYETRDTQVCVSEGHYETHIEHVRVADAVSPVGVVNPLLAGFDVRLGR